MTTIIFSIVLFLDILRFIVIIDVIISWLMVFWLKIRPNFIADIIDPMYDNIKKIIPTKIWMFDLTPIVVLFIILFLKWILIVSFPEVQSEILKLQSNF